MKKLLGSLMLFVMGWKLKNEVPVNELRKCVLICAPHTSNWDLYYCLASFWSLKIPYRVMIKDAYTKPWYGFFFKAIGCLGVDRSKYNNLVEYSSELIKNSESMALINTPEATRSRSLKWKKGFYYIAKQANVPIALAYADYKNKVTGVSKIINIGDKTIEEVFDQIEIFYKPEMAKYPENYNPKIY